MEYVFILFSFLVHAIRALPAYENIIDNNDPRNYKNIEILLLESAVDQDGGYSFSFENDDGSKVSQEGQQKIIDDEHAVERIRGSYSYTDVNGQQVSLSYTADENGFRPVGTHLPTPPPIPLEILRSLKFLATAKPFVDEELYDYKPKKKVFRGRQYNTANAVPRSRNNLRSSTLPTGETPSEPRVHQFDAANFAPRSRNNFRSNTFTQSVTETPSVTQSKSVESHGDSRVETTSETVAESSSQTAPEVATDSFSGITSGSVQGESVVGAVNESMKKIHDALKETIEKTSEITRSATNETASAVTDEANKLTDALKVQVNELSAAGIAIDKSAKQSREVIDRYASFVSDAVSAANGALVDIELPNDSPRYILT